MVPMLVLLGSELPLRVCLVFFPQQQSVFSSVCHYGHLFVSLLCLYCSSLLRLVWRLTVARLALLSLARGRERQWIGQETFFVEILCVSGYFYILHLSKCITLFSCSSISRYNHLLWEGQMLWLLAVVGVSLLSHGNWASGWLVDDSWLLDLPI